MNIPGLLHELHHAGARLALGLPRANNKQHVRPAKQNVRRRTNPRRDRINC